MAPLQVFSHHGPLTAQSRQNPALAFFETYTAQVDSLDLSGDFSRFYAPSAVFHNTDTVEYRGGARIWSWMGSLFGPFRKMHHDVTVIDGWEQGGPDGGYVLYAQTMTHFWLGDNVEAVKVPRVLRFEIRPAEVPGQGTGGLQIWDASVWWDTAMLKKH